jgi:KipI family sensor histidine kinase inhibitor
MNPASVTEPRYPRILTAGDAAVTVEFGDAVRAGLNDRVRGLAALLEEKPIRGVTETVPAYCSALVCYDPLIIRHGALVRRLRRYAERAQAAPAGGCRVFTLPVCYGGGYGEDLEDVAVHTGLSAPEVIRRHSAAEYRIYMMGFLPGFAYLGGLDPALATPRLTTPRVKIPAGAVGIGGEQTGVYPLDSPGGWHLIGRTPVRPYDASRNPAILYRAGDCIRFSPISAAEYADIERQIEQGVYHYDVREGA